jgi:hypothetical protein
MVSAGTSREEGNALAERTPGDCNGPASTVHRTAALDHCEGRPRERRQSYQKKEREKHTLENHAEPVTTS